MQEGKTVIEKLRSAAPTVLIPEVSWYYDVSLDEPRLTVNGIPFHMEAKADFRKKCEAITEEIMKMVWAERNNKSNEIVSYQMNAKSPPIKSVSL